MSEYFIITGNPLLDGILWFCIGFYLFCILISLFFMTYNIIGAIKERIELRREEKENNDNDNDNNDYDEEE